MATISEKLNKALNDQMQFEIASGYLYWGMAAYCESINLPGFAHWLVAQYHEEVNVHARKFYSYIIERGGRAELGAIDKPPVEWKSPLAIFEAAYKHECIVTERIYKLAELARKEGDLATVEFLNWFIKEQVEEEKSTDEIVQILKMAGEKNVQALFMINARLAERKFGG